MAAAELLVDPAVSQQKFEREVLQYHALEGEHLKRGRWLLKAEYPEIFVVFATPQLSPPSVVLAVIFDFTNYASVPMTQPGIARMGGVLVVLSNTWETQERSFIRMSLD